MPEEVTRIDINRVAQLTAEADATIDDMFEHHTWSPEQHLASGKVRAALANAVKVIVVNVPPSADRSVAIRKLREARMDANSAITHGGRY